MNDLETIGLLAVQLVQQERKAKLAKQAFNTAYAPLAEAVGKSFDNDFVVVPSEYLTEAREKTDHLYRAYRREAARVGAMRRKLNAAVRLKLAAIAVDDVLDKLQQEQRT